MKYSVGDILVDIRGKERRFFLITEKYVDGLEPAYYRVYITPDEREDVYSEDMINVYVDKHCFVHYPVVKE